MAEDNILEERNTGTGDSGGEDRDNPGTGDTERVSSMVEACSFSFSTEEGDDVVSLFRLLLLITIICVYLSTPTGIWNVV